jgi:hypothetical protein
VTGLPRHAAGIAAFLVATAAAAAPFRVALERPAHPDPIAVETLTRLQAELAAAGFAVTLVDPGTSAGAAAVVRLVDAGRGGAEIWIAEPPSTAPLPHHVDAGATPEPSRPAALAIRAVELLRARVLDRGSSADPRAAAQARPPRATLDDAADLEDPPPATQRAGAARALLEGPTVELGIAALYGLGDTRGRLTPIVRGGLGTAMGLAGRLTLLGTSSDQAALVEIAYGFGRWWRAMAPVVSVGAGGWHTHLDDTATPKVPHLITEAWGGALSAGAGVAARVTDRAAFLVDAHAILIDLGPGAVVGGAPAGGRTSELLTISLGVMAGF